MRCGFYISVCFGFLAACSNEHLPETKDVTIKNVKNENRINFSEDKIDSIPEPEIIEWPNKVLLDNFVQYFSEAYHIIPEAYGVLPERFTNLVQTSYTLTRQAPVLLQDSTWTKPVLKIWHFKYADTTQLQNVVRNWFQEFDEDRKEIIPGITEKINTKKTGVVYISSEEIYVLQAECADFIDYSYDQTKQNFKIAFKTQDPKYAFAYNCDGKLKWMHYPLQDSLKQNIVN